MMIPLIYIQILVEDMMDFITMTTKKVNLVVIINFARLATNLRQLHVCEVSDKIV